LLDSLLQEKNYFQISENRRMNFLALGFFILCLLLSPQLSAAASINAILQLVVFLLLAHVPALMTGRMSYVDLAWPWGLVALGLQPLLSPTPDQAWLDRRTLVAAAYTFAGLRMGLGAVALWVKGHLNEEMPRYLYQRLRWAKKGVTEESSWMFCFEMQKEILVQALCNMGILAIPLMLQSQSYLKSPLTPLEIGAWIVWVVALLVEHKADLQKKAFVRQCVKDKVKDAVCEVGLWRYSRHPNYFCEWMVWCSLVVSSVPSLLALLAVEEENLITKVGLSGGLLFVIHAMYQCLVNYTGAVPAEFYSIKKRPAYADYQRRVNMFFPGPRRE